MMTVRIEAKTQFPQVDPQTKIQSAPAGGRGPPPTDARNRSAIGMVDGQHESTGSASAGMLLHGARSPARWAKGVRTSGGWHAQAGQSLSQGWEPCRLSLEYEPVDGGLLVSAGLEIGVSCEHDDLRLRSQPLEPRRRVEPG